MLKSKKVAALAFAVALPIAMLVPTSAHAANIYCEDPATGKTSTAAVTLYAPKDLPGVPADPYGGTVTPAFTTTDKMENLDVSPSLGTVDTPITITGKGLAPNTDATLTWSTAKGAWITEVQPNTVNYCGFQYDKYTVNMATVKTDANGAFSYKTIVPKDWGGAHDIYAVAGGKAIAHGGFQTSPKLTVSPKSGPIGTPVKIKYEGMGPTLYTGGISVLWDNKFVGEGQAVWTRGTGEFTIYAAGPVGKKTVQVEDGIGVQYMNIKQSPVPYAKGGKTVFTVTADNGAKKAFINWPAKVTPTVAQRTMAVSSNVDANSKAVMTVKDTSGAVGDKSAFSVTDIADGTYDVVFATVQGSRVNCPTQSCWVYAPSTIGKVTASGGKITNEPFTYPDDLGGFHVLQLKQGNTVYAQASIYIKASIFEFKDKKGKVLSYGVAKADPSPLPESRDGAGVPTLKFKQGEEFTISLKGVGWTQMDNTMAVTYDNAHVGYGCGFNSNGWTVIHMYATGEPGTHIIDLHPQLYAYQPSFANTQYSMLPLLTNYNDDPALALGYQLPSIHFEITVTK